MIEELHNQVAVLQDKLGRARTPVVQGNAGTLSASFRFEDVEYQSAMMRDITDRCRRAAQYGGDLILYGERGTEKSWFAQGIHNAGETAAGPFVAVNCAAVAADVIEQMLLGTGQCGAPDHGHQPGLIFQADGGTLFLDEIDALDVGVQERIFHMIHGTSDGSEPLPVHVRLIAAASLPPDQAVDQGKLFPGLHFQMGSVHIPPLRERKEDVACLTERFITQYNRAFTKNIRGVDGIALSRFLAYDWPGNVYELQHVVKHAMSTMPDAAVEITQEYIPTHILMPHMEASQKQNTKTGATGSLTGTMQDYARNAICEALKATAGNITQSARLLRMSRQSLQYRIKRYKIDVDSAAGR